MAYSPFATCAFVGTNYRNVYTNGDWTRYPVLLGQSVNAYDAAVGAGAKKTGIIAKTLQKSSSIFENLAKSDRVFNGVSKAVGFVKRNINPLIVASSATKVALAKKDERKEVICNQAGLLAGMFGAEGWMKHNLEPKILKKLPIDKKWYSVVKGLMFVTGSLTGSAVGQYAGNKVHELTEAKAKPLDIKS